MRFLEQFVARARQRWADSKKLMDEVELQMALEEAQKHKGDKPKRHRGNTEILVFWTVVTLLACVLWTVIKDSAPR